MKTMFFVDVLKDPPKNICQKKSPSFCSGFTGFVPETPNIDSAIPVFPKDFWEAWPPPELPTPLAQLFQDVLLAVSEDCFGGMWGFYNDKLSPLFSIIPK